MPGDGTTFVLGAGTMNRRRLASASLVLLLLSLAACVRETHLVATWPPEPVAIRVEVYDPVTAGVWEGVGVRIVQADQEWSGCTCVSPYTDSFELTDRAGLVDFNCWDIASYEVGFPLDAAGRAVLGHHPAGDQATVTLEIWAPGYRSVFVDVDLSWHDPYVSVSVPFF